MSNNADFVQQRGHLPSPEECAEICRNFRNRCSVYDGQQMAKLRTYIEEGLLIVIRPDRLELAEIERDAAVEQLGFARDAVCVTCGKPRCHCSTCNTCGRPIDSCICSEDDADHE